jgi:tetratricopeptide (TPR) repeat protein
MHQPNQRTAIAALDAARPVIARLDTNGHPDEIAADLLESWAAVETALRALLGGSSLSGQALVSEVRQRGLLDYRHAHSLLGFLAARDRAGRTDHRPTSEDVDAARSGFQVLESALGIGIAANTGMFRTVPGPGEVPTDAPSGMPYDRSTRPTPAVAVGRRADRAEAAPLPSADPAFVESTAAGRGRGVSSGLVVFGALALLLAAVGGWWFWSESQNPRTLRAGIDAFQDGRREVARRQFEEAVDAQPKLALPHVYLARMAREDGDMTRAYREITAAINLEPGNAIAQREMGQYLLQANQPQLARNFLERAIKLDPADRTAQGWMACALSRMGSSEVAERFYQRAGQGAWTACRQAAPGFAPPGGQALPQPAATGTVVPGPAPRRP